MPRLTSRLRSNLLGKPDAGTLDELFKKRAQLLAERRQERADMASGPTSGSRSQLIASTLGDWKTSPKAARDAFDTYIHAVSKLLGGEASSAEVSEAAMTAWDALSALPAVSAEDIRRKGAAAAELQRALGALQPLLSSHIADTSAVRDFLPKFTALLKWHQELNPHHATSKARSTAQHANIQHTTKQSTTNQNKQPGSTAISDLVLPWKNDDEAVLATCGLSQDHPAALLFTREAPGGPPASTPFERRPERTVPGVSADTAAAVEAEVFGANKGLGVNSAAGGRWLSRWCSSVTGNNSTISNRTSTSDNDDDDDSVATTVALMVLSENTSDDTLAAELFDLIGENVFDHIGALLDQRRSLSTNLRGVISSLREAEAAEAAAARSSGPSYGTGVTVMSESEKIALKAERKADRRRAKQQSGASGIRGGGGGFGQDADLEWLSRYGLRAIVDEEVDKEDALMKIRLGDGMEFRLGEGSRVKGALPKGTTRKAYKGYEEVHVPAIATGIRPPGERSVRIEELPDWAQLAFEGYTALNRIQSKIFDTAFSSNENMLVCAPTGAGKTNIAMISVLREVGQHMQGGEINKSEFKIVYVAPMKALAAEVTASFSKRLAPLGKKLS